MAEERVTVAEAVALTRLSRKTIEGRIERRTLPAEKRGGRLFVPRAELYRQRLVPVDRATAEEYVVSELLDRLERQAERIGELEAELQRAKGDGA